MGLRESVMPSRNQIMKRLDETIELLEEGNVEFRNQSSGCSISLCSYIGCDNCPANSKKTGHLCAFWESQHEEIVNFCFVKAMFETGDL